MLRYEHNLNAQVTAALKTALKLALLPCRLTPVNVPADYIFYPLLLLLLTGLKRHKATVRQQEAFQQAAAGAYQVRQLRGQLNAAVKAGRSLDEQAGVIENELLERVETAMQPGASEPGEQGRTIEGPHGTGDERRGGQEAGRDREQDAGEGWDGVESNIEEGRKPGGDVQRSELRVAEALGEVQCDLTTGEGLHEALQDILGYLRERYCYCLYCGCKYDDSQDMARNCPGLAEADHD